MSTTTNAPIPESMEQTLETIKEAQNHHKKFRDEAGKLYSYHHQMISHLQEQIDKLSKS